MIQRIQLLCCTLFILLPLASTSASLHKDDKNSHYIRSVSFSSDTKNAPQHIAVALSESQRVSSVSTATPSTSPKPSVLVNTASPTISLEPSSFSEQSAAVTGIPTITPTVSPTTSYVPYKQPITHTTGSGKPTVISIPSEEKQASDIGTLAPTFSYPVVNVARPPKVSSSRPVSDSDSIHNSTSSQPKFHEELDTTPNLISAVSQDEMESISHVKETTTALPPQTTRTTAAIGSQVLMAFLGAFVTSIFFFTLLAIRRRMRSLAEAELYTIYDATAGRHLSAQNKTHNTVAVNNTEGCSSPTEEQQGRILPDISNSGSSIHLSSLGTIYEHDYENGSDQSSSSIDQMFQFSLQMSEDLSLSPRSSWDGGDYWSNTPCDLPSPFPPSEAGSPFSD